jgi:hypothetical protein
VRVSTVCLAGNEGNRGDAARRSPLRRAAGAAGQGSRLQAAGGVLVEDGELARLRPTCSVAEEIESALLAAAVRWLGVDGLPVRLPRGRPSGRAQPAEAGGQKSSSLLI